jgi:hypothetical protein
MIGVIAALLDVYAFCSIVLGLRPSLFGDCFGFLRGGPGFPKAFPNNIRTKSTKKQAQTRREPE